MTSPTRSIYKYEIPHDGLVIDGWPTVLHVDRDPTGVSELPFVWAEVERAGGGGLVECRFVGTGHPLTDVLGWTHAGSCIARGGFVWHVYTRATSAPATASEIDAEAPETPTQPRDLMAELFDSVERAKADRRSTPKETP